MDVMVLESYFNLDLHFLDVDSLSSELKLLKIKWVTFTDILIQTLIFQAEQ